MTDTSRSLRPGVSPDGRPTLDRTFELLAHRHRRHVLAVLVTADPGGVSIADLVSAPAEEDRVAVTLHHVHLPKLDDAGCIEWDRADDRVRRGPRFGEIAPIVELVLADRQELLGSWQ